MLEWEMKKKINAGTEHMQQSSLSTEQTHPSYGVLGVMKFAHKQQQKKEKIIQTR